MTYTYYRVIKQDEVVFEYISNDLEDEVTYDDDYYPLWHLLDYFKTNLYEVLVFIFTTEQLYNLLKDNEHTF